MTSKCKLMHLICTHDLRSVCMYLRLVCMYMYLRPGPSQFFILGGVFSRARPWCDVWSRIWLNSYLENLENFKHRSWRLVDLKDYETSVFNKQDDPGKLPCRINEATACHTLLNNQLSRSNLSTMNKYRRHKRSVRMIRRISARKNQIAIHSLILIMVYYLSKD